MAVKLGEPRFGPIAREFAESPNRSGATAILKDNRYYTAILFDNIRFLIKHARDRAFPCELAHAPDY
jgi:hypothetical protein